MSSEVSYTKGACVLWEEGLLLDYTVEVEDEQFRVHKVIMASVSDYFKAMLTGGMKESNTDQVRLEGLSSDKVSAMIKFIYTGQFGATEASTEDLLECAVYLQMPAAINKCTKLLVDKVNPQNCFQLLSTFQNYNVENGVKQTTEYINSNIEKIMQVCIPLEMSYLEFLNFMNFWKKSEWELVMAVTEWVSTDLKKRQKHLYKLMTHIRFALLTPEQLEDIKPIKIYLDSNNPWNDLIDNAEVFHNLPTHRKVLDVSIQSRMRGDPVPVCYTANDESSSVFYSLHDGKSWKQHEALLAPDLCNTDVIAYLTVNNYLIVCEYTDYSHPTNQGWHIFDPRTLTWSTMACMNITRQNFAVVHHEKYLYALGGRTRESFKRPDGTQEPVLLTDVIERYNFENNTWNVIPNKLPLPLEFHSAGVMKGLIYVCGGHISPPWRSTNRLDCLDLSTDTWHSRAPIPNLYHSSQPRHVMELGDEEVLFGIDDYYEMHYYSPSTDQWSVWECLQNVDSEIIRGGLNNVIVDRNTLFLYGFQYVEKTHSSDNNYNMYIDYDDFNGCVKWKVGKNGDKISEVRLENYPAEGAEYSESGWVSLAAFLSIPPQL